MGWQYRLTIGYLPEIASANAIIAVINVLPQSAGYTSRGGYIITTTGNEIIHDFNATTQTTYQHSIEAAVAKAFQAAAIAYTMVQALPSAQISGTIVLLKQGAPTQKISGIIVLVKKGPPTSIVSGTIVLAKKLPIHQTSGSIVLVKGPSPPPPPYTGQQIIMIDKSTYNMGDPVKFSGTGFSSNGEVVIGIYNAILGSQIATTIVHASSGGAISGTVYVPQTPTPPKYMIAYAWDKNTSYFSNKIPITITNVREIIESGQIVLAKKGKDISGQIVLVKKRIVTEPISGTIVFVKSTAPPPTPVPSPCTKPDNWLNPIDWMEYLACIVNNGLTYMGGILATSFSQLWNLTPTWFTDTFGNIIKAVQAMINFLTDPTPFISAIATGIFKESSPSISSDFLEGFRKVGMDHSHDIDLAKYEPLASWIRSQIETKLGLYVPQLIAIIQNPQLDPVQAQASILALKAQIEGEVYGLAAYVEMVPFVDISVFNDVARSVLSSFAVENYDSIVTDAIAKAGLIELARQYANKNISVKLPDLDTLILSKQRGEIGDTQYVDKATKQSGMNQDNLTLTYKSKLQVPTLDDFFTWNARHPDAQIDLAKIASVAGIQITAPSTIGVDYGDIFKERYWNDPSLRQLRMLYDAKTITDSDVDAIISRLRFRTDVLHGMTKSDFQIMHDYVTGAQAIKWNNQELSTVRVNFIQGLASESALVSAATKLIADTQARSAFINSAKERQTAYMEKYKHFPLALLVTLLAEKTIDGTFVDAEIDAQKYDTSHREILKRYVRQAADAKIAKAARTSTTTS